jgi:hypothetical protein
VPESGQIWPRFWPDSGQDLAQTGLTGNETFIFKKIRKSLGNFDLKKVQIKYIFPALGLFSTDNFMTTQRLVRVDRT